MANPSNAGGFTSLLGTFKQNYANSIVETYKAKTPILASTPWMQGNAQGGVFHVPVQLTLGGGVTVAPGSVSGSEVVPGSGGRTYVGPNSGKIGDAQVTGMQVLGRTQMTYEALSRSMEGANASAAKKAVKSAKELELASLTVGTLKKIEALMLHGRRGLGVIEAISNVVATNYDPGSGTVAGFAVDIGITLGSWLEALFLASEGHGFDLFADSGGLPTGNALNTTTNTFWDGTNQTGFVLIAVEPSTVLTNYSGSSAGLRTLRLWHSSGTAGASGTGVIGGWTTTAAAGLAAAPVHVCIESGGPSNEFVGLMSQATNTGTLFNLSATTYSMWRGNTVSGNSSLNMKLAELVRYCSKAINAGAAGERMRAVVPTELFVQIGNDEAALRRYDGRESSANGGMRTIEVFGPMNTVIELLGHNLQKPGEILVYPTEECARVGSQDIEYVDAARRPVRGMSEQDFTLHSASIAAAEIRSYGFFAPVLACPKHCVGFTGVTY